MIESLLRLLNDEFDRFALPPSMASASEIKQFGENEYALFDVIDVETVKDHIADFDS